MRSARPNLAVASKSCTFGTKKISIHIASGDIFRLSNYDILVNSENDYMQMARIFDMASLSSNIRHYGSATEKGYLEDTIQLEIKGPLLDDHARFRRDCHLDKFWWTFKQPCDLDGTAWHKPVAPASRHDRARSALELRNASPCRPRYRLGTAAHSQAVLQSGRE